MVTDAKTISYNVEITEKGFVQVSSEVTKLNKAFSSVGESSKNMSLAIKTVVKDVRANTEAHGRTVNVMNAEISGLEQLRDSYGKSNKLYRQVQSRINAVIAEKKSLTDVSSKEVRQEKTLLQQISALNDGRKRTVDVIQQEISLRKQMQSSTSTNRKEFLKEEIEIKKLERGLNSIAKSQSKVIRSSVKMGTATKSLNKKLGNTSSATGTASGAVVELGRTVSDSNYGFPAMANNVQQFATQMSFLVQETKSVKGAFVQLGKAMTGAGGVLLLISIAISIFERLALKARETKSEIKGVNEELAKSQGTIENLQMLAKILNESEKGTAAYNMALKELKKEGFNEAIGSLEQFIELKKAERELDKKQDPLKKERIEALTKQSELETEISSRQEKLNKGFKDRFLKGRTVTAEQQADVVRKAMLKFQEEFDLNRITVEGINKQMEDNFVETAKSLSDNPFFNLKGGEGDNDIDFVEGVEFGVEELEEWLAENEPRLQDLFNKVRGFDPEDVNVSEEFDFNPDTDPELQNLLDRYERMKEADEKYASFKKKLTDRTLDMLEGSFGKETAIAKAAFIAKQLMAAKEIFIEAKKAITFSKLEAAKSVAAVEAGKAQTLKAGFPQNVPLLIAYAAQATSIMSSIKSAFKTADDVATSVGGGVSGGGAATSNNIQAPDFNIVGASNESQLAQTISQSEQQPIQAFVVAEDITTAQQLDNNIIQGASLG